MSRFKRERLYASVELDRVALVRLNGDGAPREDTVVALPLDPEQPEGWSKAARAALARPEWRGAPRSIVLSDRLARYVVMERPQGVRSSAELRLACEARFQASFERPAAEWEIAIDARPFGRHIFACGIARRLIEAVREVFGREGSVASLQPFLVCELNRLARKLPAECWFVAVARDCVTLCGIKGGECRVIRVLPSEQPDLNLIQDALERETLLTGELAADAPVLIAGILEGELGSGAMLRLDAPSWGTQSSHWASGYRLALAERWT